MQISLVQGQTEKPTYEPLDPDWISSSFVTLKEATDFATAHGWQAKPQAVQLRKTDGVFIVEKYDSCGCGG